MAIVEEALAFDARAIVEPCLDRPRELEMGVLGNTATGLTLLGPGEVIPDHEFYDYADKYAAGSAARTARGCGSARGQVAEEVRRIGGAAFTLIGAAGFARVDLLLDRVSGRLSLSEINTIPGFTPISLYPKVAEAAGIPFGELCARIVDLGAAARAARPVRQPGHGGSPAMSDDLPVRGGRVRQRPGPRRASGGFSPRRALAALAMLATAGLIWGAVASPVFAVKTVEVEGAILTGDDAVRAALALPTPAPNAFTLATDDLRERLLALPAVADAEVSVGLPGVLRVRIVEREPVLAWRLSGALLLVDRDGRVVADAGAAGDGPAGAAAVGLPVVADRRPSDVTPAVGDHLDELDLDVATRLLSLLPADVDSEAPGLPGRRRRAGWLDARPDGRGPVDGGVRLLRPRDPGPGDDPGAGAPAQEPARGTGGRAPAGGPRRSARGHLHAEAGAVTAANPVGWPAGRAAIALRSAPGSGSLRKTQSRRGIRPVLLPLAGLLVGVLLGLVLNVNVGFELSRYSAVAILAALDSVLGAVRAELEGVYDNRIFVSGFVVNTVVAVLLTFIGDRLGLDLYLVALITFGLRIFQNVALIRRHYL